MAARVYSHSRPPGVRRATYEEALPFRPLGACVCDLSDEECYYADHWNRHVNKSTGERCSPTTSCIRKENL